MRSFIIALTIFTSIVSRGLAQDDHFLLKGELRNAKTQEKIPWASLYIKDTSLGVPSNQNGEFEFSIASDHHKDSLIVSAMGYERISFLIEDLKKHPANVILLREKIYQLDEIIIEDPDPAKIVKTAVDKWVGNFTTSKYEFESFYRTTIRENGKYSRLWECAIRGYDKGGDSDKKSTVDIEYTQIRKSDDYRDSRTRWLFAFFKPQFIFTGENHTRNDQVFLKKIGTKAYGFELDSTVYLEDAAIYVINANVVSDVKEFLFDIRFYIRKEDHAIIQLDFNGKRNLSWLKPSGIPGKLKIQMTEYKSTYVFKEIDKKMFMYYMNVYAAFNWTDEAKKVIYQEENSEAIIQNIRQLSPTEKSSVKPNYPRVFYGTPHTSYNSAFWKNYDMLKQIPYNKGALNDLQKETSLEEQFLKNGPEPVKKK